MAPPAKGAALHCRANLGSRCSCRVQAAMGRGCSEKTPGKKPLLSIRRGHRAAVLSCDLAAVALRSVPPRFPRIRSWIRRCRSRQTRPSWITRTPPPPAPQIRRLLRIRIPRTLTPPRIHCHTQLGPEPRWAQLLLHVCLRCSSMAAASAACVVGIHRRLSGFCWSPTTNGAQRITTPIRVTLTTGEKRSLELQHKGQAFQGEKRAALFFFK
ncbi:uncharacterized protein [Triticum aestivum]|uniref:uncharacterized protein n=1 Tax=Triticum aestivum TaxID=4565 RepID=UPI001D0222AF|nr:uncharacterized protein LOC123079058 [Triticum aestivum]